MDSYTFGNSRAAVNLMSDILEKPEYKKYSTKVAKLLDKQFKVLNAVAGISDRAIRETTLQMWHKRFVDRVEDLPKVIKTHILSIAVGRYRQLLGQDKG